MPSALALPDTSSSMKRIESSCFDPSHATLFSFNPSTDARRALGRKTEPLDGSIQRHQIIEPNKNLYVSQTQTSYFPHQMS